MVQEEHLGGVQHRNLRGWRGRIRPRRLESPGSRGLTARTARKEPVETSLSHCQLPNPKTGRGSPTTHRFNRDVLKDPTFRVPFDGRLHVAVREPVHGMREGGIRAALRFRVGPFGKVGLGRAARFFLLGEKESWRGEEVDFGRVEVGEVR